MKIKLKPNKKETIFLVTLLGIVLLFLITDVIMLENNKTPIFCKNVAMYLDGGTTVYLGFGYKIIDYNVLDGYEGYKVGTWLMQYDKSLS